MSRSRASSACVMPAIAVSFAILSMRGLAHSRCRSTTKWLMLYPKAAPMKMSDEKCARVGSLLSERTVAVPYDIQGTQECFGYRSAITVAIANAEAVWPEGKLPLFVNPPLYLNHVSR